MSTPEEQRLRDQLTIERASSETGTKVIFAVVILLILFGAFGEPAHSAEPAPRTAIEIVKASDNPRVMAFCIGSQFAAVIKRTGKTVKTKAQFRKFAQISRYANLAMAELTDEAGWPEASKMSRRGAALLDAYGRGLITIPQLSKMFAEHNKKYDEMLEAEGVTVVATVLYAKTIPSFWKNCGLATQDLMSRTALKLKERSS